MVNTDTQITDGYSAKRHIFEDDPSIRMYRVGKKRAGRLLDGREYSEIPEVSK